MVFIALRLLAGALGRVFEAALLGLVAGLLVGAVEGAVVGGVCALAFSTFSAARGSGFDLSFLATGAMAGLVIGVGVGIGVGIVAFAVLETARMCRRQPMWEEALIRAVDPASRVAMLGALCGLLVGLAFDSAEPDSRLPYTVLFAVFSWSVGFFFGTLFGGLCERVPQFGVAPLDWLLRWIWRR